VLVTFEGIEAAGKSTLIAALAKRTGHPRGSRPNHERTGRYPLGDALRNIFLDPAFRVDPMAE